MPNTESKVQSFELTEVSVSEKTVFIAVHEKFCRALGLGLVKGSDNPCLRAMGHQILNAGQILRGAPAGDFPELADLVTNDEVPAAEVEESENVTVS